MAIQFLSVDISLAFSIFGDCYLAEGTCFGETNIELGNYCSVVQTRANDGNSTVLIRLT